MADTKLRTGDRHRAPGRAPLGGRGATVVELRPARGHGPKRETRPSRKTGQSRSPTVRPDGVRSGRKAGASTTPTAPSPTAPSPRLARPKISRPTSVRQAAAKVDIGQALRRSPVPRAPFVLLVLGLLGGSLICLLVINTTLGATSFRISQLQSTNANLTQQEHTLRQQIAGEESPDQIAKAAERLGMRQPSQLTFMNPHTRQIYRQDAGHPQKVNRAGSTR